MSDFKNIGSSIFWIITILASLMGLAYLGIWSYHNNSVQGIAMSTIFFGMIVAGILLSKFEILDQGTWGESCLSFVLGFSAWTIIGLVQKTTSNSALSVLSITQNSLFATIASQLPQYLEFLMTSFVIPISEELFWMVGIPFALITIMNLIGKKWSIFTNIWIQLVVIAIVTGITFAQFHVGDRFLIFLLAAFIFRTIMVFLIVSSSTGHWEIFKGVALVTTFSVGAHIANNLNDFGIGNGISLLWANFNTGIFIFLYFAIIFVTAGIEIRNIVTGRPTI